MKAPAGLPDEAKEEKAKLSKLKGKDFDSEFASYMVDDHKKDIAKYQEQANGAADQKVKDFANATLPVLQKHLDAAQKLATSQSSAK